MRCLRETGHAAGAVVVEHATTTRQRITRLADFAHDERPYFSTILCYRGDEAWGAGMNAPAIIIFAESGRDTAERIADAHQAVTSAPAGRAAQMR